MLSPINSSLQPQLSPVRDEEVPTRKKKPPLFLRHTMPSGEKVILASNLTLIVAAVAYTFFSIKLPLLSIGFALYGIFYLTFNNRVKKGAPTSEEVARLKEKIEELNGKIIISLTTKSLGQQHEELLNKHRELRSEVDELEEDIRKKKEASKELDKEIKQKKSYINSLNSSLQQIQKKQLRV